MGITSLIPSSVTFISPLVLFKYFSRISSIKWKTRPYKRQLRTMYGKVLREEKAKQCSLQVSPFYVSIKSLDKNGNKPSRKTDLGYNSIQNMQ